MSHGHGALLTVLAVWSAGAFVLSEALRRALGVLYPSRADGLRVRTLGDVAVVGLGVVDALASGVDLGDLDGGPERALVGAVAASQGRFVWHWLRRRIEARADEGRIS